MRKIAEKRGGKCLSDTYINTHSKLLWECPNGHRWEARPSSIKRGSWCPTCANIKKGESQRLTLDDCNRKAREQGGRCLSKTYKNAHSKLLWECAEGHQWEATPNSIRWGSWCPFCYGRYPTIEEMHRLAQEHGGKCLSDTYMGAFSKLLWECAEGHQWESAPTNIKSGTWCPYCGGSLKLTIEKMKLIAEERGGRCLSSAYKNAHTKLLWECAHGHQWKATANNICKGKWCPECSSGLGERICREFFEQIFGKKFPKSRPKWLLNKNGNQMELDGFCPSLKLAFEHQGQQHYEQVRYFYGSKNSFKKRQLYDELKRRLCQEHGIVLIEIPEIPTLLSVEEVKSYIKGECHRKNIHYPRVLDENEINLKRAYITSGSEQILNELRIIAKEKGGSCLADTYINNSSKILWECKQGHQWKASSGSVKSGSWCPYCAGTLRSTIEEMRRIAKERGGQCLSIAYKNTHTKLLWECAKGHQWKAVPFSVKRGSWCPICATEIKADALRFDLGKLRQIAEKRGGKCLSDTYINTNSKLLWECANGHQWEARPSNIKRGKWCPYCSGIARLTIEEMRDIAETRGGKCLSKIYKNNKTKLLWECAEGHQWKATPDKIKRGSWCPECWALKRKKRAL